MTPEEFNAEIKSIEAVIGCECPTDLKKMLWYRCKNNDVDFFRASLEVYKITWKDIKEIELRKKRHANS